jgi:hypothetical protein
MGTETAGVGVCKQQQRGSSQRQLASLHASFFTSFLRRDATRSYPVVTVLLTRDNTAPAFRAHGRVDAENLALQNIQARLRMVITYFFALWACGWWAGCSYPGSAKVDENLKCECVLISCAANIDSDCG